jgi:hypothetical protein
MLAMTFSRFPYCLRSRRRPKKLAGAEGFEPPSSVLETDSLTVELTPLWIAENPAIRQLLHFLVRRVLAADAAELFQLQTLGHRLPVLGG